MFITVSLYLLTAMLEPFSTNKSFQKGSFNDNILSSIYEQYIELKYNHLQKVIRYILDWSITTFKK